MPVDCECKDRKTRFCIFPECLKSKSVGRFGKRVKTFNHATQKHITVGNQSIYQRSSWEGNFARALQWHKETGKPFDGLVITHWEHEPRTFMFDPERANKVWELYKRKLTGIRKGTTSYKPDFRVHGYKAIKVGEELFESVPTFDKWYEVKGHYESKDFTKKKRMGQYWPEVDLEFIDKEWFILNQRFYRSVIQDWEVIKL